MHRRLKVPNAAYLGRGCTAVRTSSVLASLDIHLEADDISLVAAAVGASTSMRRLVVTTDHTLSESDTHAFAAMLEQSRTLRVLKVKFKRGGVTDWTACVKILACGVERSTSLTTLAIQNCEFSRKAAFALARAMERCTTMTSLSLDCSGITDAGVKELALGVERSASMRKLKIYGSFMTGASAAFLASAMQHGLTKLASHDGDFDSVAGITRYGPA